LNDEQPLNPAYEDVCALEDTDTSGEFFPQVFYKKEE